MATCLAVLAAGVVLVAPAGAASYAKGVDVSNWQGDRRLAPGRRRRLHLHVREGDRRHDVHGHHVSGEPRGCASACGMRHRRVPLRAACRRERRRDRLERRRAGRPLRRCRPTEGWRPATRARPRGERRALPHQSREVDAGMGRRGHGPHRSPRAHLRRRRASGRPRSATRRASRNRESRSGSRIGRRSASPLVPASNWNGLGWMFWQWSCVHRGAGLRKMRRRRPSGYADRRRVRDQGLSRRLPVPQHTADDRRHGPGRKQARRRAGHLGRRQAGRLQLPVAEL